MIDPDAAIADIASIASILHSLKSIFGFLLTERTSGVSPAILYISDAILLSCLLLIVDNQNHNPCSSSVTENPWYGVGWPIT